MILVCALSVVWEVWMRAQVNKKDSVFCSRLYNIYWVDWVSGRTVRPMSRQVRGQREWCYRNPFTYIPPWAEAGVPCRALEGGSCCSSGQNSLGVKSSRGPGERNTRIEEGEALLSVLWNSVSFMSDSQGENHRSIREGRRNSCLRAHLSRYEIMLLLRCPLWFWAPLHPCLSSAAVATKSIRKVSHCLLCHWIIRTFSGNWLGREELTPTLCLTPLNLTYCFI